ncbi:MAG: hypothetical protein Q4G47_00185 [Lachnospiraceae bacterium]|nr:hypothetical protein [Lachnospiraceae bacterium]
MTISYLFANARMVRRTVLVAVMFAAVLFCAPVYAGSSSDVTETYAEDAERMLRQFDDYFGYGCSVDAAFTFDNCARTTMLCLKNLNFFGRSLRQVRDVNYDDWVSTFGETPAFTMKKHSGDLYDGFPSQWANPSYLVQLVDGEARYLGGRWENLHPKGDVKRVVRSSDGRYIVTYDVSWYTEKDNLSRLMGTYKIALKPYDNEFGFAITGIWRTSAQVLSSKLEKNNCTQALDLFDLGRAAYMGDASARDEITGILADIVTEENESYGLMVSVILAKIIEESGWVSYENTAGYLLHGANNLTGMNYGNFDRNGNVYAYSELTGSGSRWDSYSTWIPADVTQRDSSGRLVGTYEAMKSYKCVEDCIEDFLSVMVDRSPKLRNNDDIEAYRSFLQSYTPYGDQVSLVSKIIKKYNLNRHD